MARARHDTTSAKTRQPHPSEGTRQPGRLLPSRARLTPQREIILSILDDFPGAFTAVDLYDRARQLDPHIGLATVYRLVELLRNAGALRQLSGERGRYVRCHTGHHHHLICRSCGAVEDTELCAAPSPAELQRVHGFAHEEHDLEIYGTCARCAA